MELLYYILVVLFIIIALFLIVLVLLQKSKGDIGAAFGGATARSIFGVGGVDTILTKGTYWFTAIFMVLAIAIAILTDVRNNSSIMQNEHISANQTKHSKP
jgi:preprotein translocase subunit SecG